MTFSLDSNQSSAALAALNAHYLGDPECNYLDRKTMQYKSKYPDKETKEFKDSVHRVRMSSRTTLRVGMDYTGGLFVIQ